ncbi:MAG: hypothetical protein ACXACP_05605 [Candidatus Hodarchaeales archaeon]|jgi:hypothetical protein
MKQKQLLVVSFLFSLSMFMVFTSTALPETEIVSIFEVTQNGPQLMITLEYDFNAAPVRGNSEALVVFTLFSLPANDGQIAIEGSILFFHTNERENFLFWTLGNPFTSSIIWQTGSEIEHFQVDQNELSLIFIELSQYDNPELEIDVLAKILDVELIDNTMNDFQEVIHSFIPDLPIDTDTSPTITTTTTTSKKSIGYEWFLVLSMFLLVISIRKKRKAN